MPSAVELDDERRQVLLERVYRRGHALRRRRRLARWGAGLAAAALLFVAGAAGANTLGDDNTLRVDTGPADDGTLTAADIPWLFPGELSDGSELVRAEPYDRVAIGFSVWNLIGRVGNLDAGSLLFRATAVAPDDSGLGEGRTVTVRGREGVIGVAEGLPALTWMETDAVRIEVRVADADDETLLTTAEGLVRVPSADEWVAMTVAQVEAGVPWLVPTRLPAGSQIWGPVRFSSATPGFDPTTGSYWLVHASGSPPVFTTVSLETTSVHALGSGPPSGEEATVRGRPGTVAFPVPDRERGGRPYGVLWWEEGDVVIQLTVETADAGVLRQTLFEVAEGLVEVADGDTWEARMTELMGAGG